MHLGQLFMVVLSLCSVSASLGLCFCAFWLCAWGGHSLPFPLPVACACVPVVPPRRLFPCLLLSGLSHFVSCSQQSSLFCCAGICPFPAPRHSQFIHLSYTLLCYCFLLDSQLQLLSCPLSRAGSSLELCAHAEPSLNHPLGTSRSPWGAGRNHTAPSVSCFGGRLSQGQMN